MFQVERQKAWETDGLTVTVENTDWAKTENLH